MPGRHQSLLRDQTGNQYCKNCEQEVYAETPFSWIVFAIASFVTMTIAGAFVPEETGGQHFLFLFVLLVFISGPASYIYYWYYIKQPTCPICKARNFGTTATKVESENDGM